VAGYRAKVDGFSQHRRWRAGEYVQDASQAGATISARTGLIDGTPLLYDDCDAFRTPLPEVDKQATIRINLPGESTVLAGLSGRVAFNQELWGPASGDITNPTFPVLFTVRLLSGITALAAIEPRWNVRGNAATGTVGRTTTVTPFNAIELNGYVGLWVAYTECVVELIGTWELKNNRPVDPWADGRPYPQTWREWYERVA
jgi:hypothetical protein